MADRTQEVLAWLRAQVGIYEKPRNSNNVEYQPMTGVARGFGPWCATFCQATRRQFGFGFIPAEYGQYHFVPSIENAAEANGTIVKGKPKVLDALTFDYQQDGEEDHIEWIIDVSEWPRALTTIGGNTSPDGSNGSDSNGGMVCQRYRNNPRIWGSVIRVNWEDGKARIITREKLILDGDFGPKSTEQLYLVLTKQKSCPSQPTTDLMKACQAILGVSAINRTGVLNPATYGPLKSWAGRLDPNVRSFTTADATRVQHVINSQPM